MARLATLHDVDAAGLDRLRRPRRDVLIERPDDDTDTWTIETGPFRSYRRWLQIADDGPDRFRVVEHIDYKLALPVWWPYRWLLFRRALREPDRRPRRRWWWPQEVVTAETSTLIALLGTIGAMAGYMGVLISQTISFAADDFGVDDGGQANTLAAVRVGVLLSMLLLGRADRWGRRPLVLGLALAAILFTATGSLAEDMFGLGASQTVARGLTTGLLTLLTVAATEEVPAGSRALSISFMTLTTGFGSALVVWVLPVADLSPGGWRLIYLIPLVFLPLLAWIARRLPETRRYRVAEAHGAPAPINWGRFALIGGTAFLSLAYLSPASQLRNEYLRDDLAFSAADVSAFQLVISLPATVAIPIGGAIADRYGRRWFGALALAGAVIASAASYQLSGPLLWLTAGLGVSMAAASIPALRGYQIELFPTRARGRVGGRIDAIAVAGSAAGLVIVGQLAVRWDDLGTAIGALVVLPLIVAAIIIAAFPETASRELEEFNPGDPSLDSPHRPSEASEASGSTEPSSAPTRASRPPS